MDLFKGKYRISSNRLDGWDYRTPGWYFITIATADRIHFFGDISNKIMCLNEIGTAVWRFWLEIPEHFPFVRLGEFIVMPNHVHGIIEITPIHIERYNISISNRNTGYHYEPNPGDFNSREQDEADQHNVEMMHASSLPGEGNKENEDTHSPDSVISPKKGSLGSVVRSFKGAVKFWCRNNGYWDFQWHRNYHDHIVRNSVELRSIEEYIRTNPENWGDDRYAG